MKKLLATTLLAAVLGAGTSGFGALSITSDMTFASEYVFRGIKLADNSFQPGLEASFDDFYIGVWGSLPTEKRSSMGYTDEWDAYVGYGFNLTDNMALDFGVTYYYYPDTVLDDTFEAYVGLNWDLDSWSPGVYLYYDIDLKAWTGQGNLGYSIPLGAAGFSLDLNAYAGYIMPDEADDFWYYGADAVIPYVINDTATVSAGLHWATNTVDGLEGNHVYFTLSATLGF